MRLCVWRSEKHNVSTAGIGDMGGGLVQVKNGNGDLLGRNFHGKTLDFILKLMGKSLKDINK